MAVEGFFENKKQPVEAKVGELTPQSRAVNVTAKVVLYSDRSVADVSQEIQDAIIRYIQYTLGIETPVKPKVIVAKVVYKKEE